MTRLLLVFILFTFWNAQSQNSKMFFSEALDIYLPTYYLKVEKAISTMEQERVKEIFDTLVENQLTGSLMDNFIVNDLDKRETSLSTYKRPVLLLTYSSWRLSCKGELAALNQLADEYSDQLDIVLLFWGTNEEVRKLSKGYHHTIDILYVDDNDNKYTLIIKNLKHSLGLPLAYTLTSTKEIIDIKKRRYNKISNSQEDATLDNYELYNDMITTLLTQERLLSNVPIVINK